MSSYNDGSGVVSTSAEDKTSVVAAPSAPRADDGSTTPAPPLPEAVVGTKEAVAAADEPVVPSGDDALLEHIRVAMIGNVDSGKSTLTGCLTKGGLDDGRGSARSRVFRHAHEAANGRTSSVGMEVMGFNGDEALTFSAKTRRADAWRLISRTATKSVSLIDLCGHERYLRTTVFGLTGHVPDYGLVVVGANMGVSRMTKEHVGIAAALRIPLIIVVTKIDLAPEGVYRATMKQVQRTLKAARKMPYLVRSDKDLNTAIDALAGERITPVIRVSNVTGEGLDILRAILRRLPSRAAAAMQRGAEKVAASASASATTPASAEGAESKTTDETVSTGESAATAATETATSESTATETPAAAGGAGGPESTEAAEATPVSESSAAPGPAAAAEVMIDSVFNVPGAGTVVAGTVMGAPIRVGDTMLLGPDRNGEFQQVLVRSIHVHYTPAEVAHPGRSAAFAIRPKGRAASKAAGKDATKRGRWARKGMFLLAPSAKPQSVWQFEAEVLILHHQTTLKCGYAPAIHAGVVHQVATVVDMRKRDGSVKETLRTGDRAVLTFRFQYRPEYLKAGTLMLLRDGRAKGVGRIRFVGKRP